MKIQDDDTVIHVFWERARETPDKHAISYKIDGKYHPLTWREHAATAAASAGAHLALDINPGDRVAIMSTSRPHWVWADIGALSVRAVTLPVYPSLNATEAEYLLKHSAAKLIFLENARQLRKLLSLEKLPETLAACVLFEGEGEPTDRLQVLSWDKFINLGNEYLQKHKDCIVEQVALIKPSDMATIVYTSGTTGVPKGAMILHSNITYICRTLAANVGFSSEDVTLSFLPLSHIFERVGGEFLCIFEGILMAFAETMESVATNVQEVRPTIMNAVPRFYEKVYNRIQAQIRSLPTPQAYFARWAISISRRASKARKEEKDPEVAKRLYRTELRIAERFVFSKIKQRLGGRMRFLVSGAAPLSLEIQQFFEALGLPILEGYGLTETTAPIACNRPNGIKQGSVGQPLPGTEVKLAADGEIMVRGPGIFPGYYNNPEATAAAFDNGWFLTGDIGEIDADGYLSIKDRKKDIIITAGGKHVAPAMIENMLCGRGLVSRVLVYGDRRKFISSLVTLNPDELATFCRNNQISGSTTELAHHPAVIAEVQRTLDEANSQLASFEQVKKFLILDRDFSVEAEELTPTLKLKRKAVTVKYQELLDGLYDREDLEVEKGMRTS